MQSGLDDHGLSIVRSCEALRDQLSLPLQKDCLTPVVTRRFAAGISRVSADMSYRRLMSTTTRWRWNRDDDGLRFRAQDSA